ncbi:MAG: serine/threonine-protein phosphatase [Acidobacteria bacterium]|nr:MAG: serine/threonine-protein phosphatase [Acidobacteriota bacterium]
MPKVTADRFQDLADELENFEEIARFLRPSSGELPTLRGLEVAGLWLPLKASIGGDHIIYLDFKKRFDLERRARRAEEAGRPDVAKKLRELAHRAGILVADVSGHRITDALIAAMLHQAFLLGVYYELDINGEVTTRLFEHLNTRFYRTTATNKFFTMIYGEIIEGGRFRFISAGHEPPAVFSREYGRFVSIHSDHIVTLPPVGLLPQAGEPAERTDVPLQAATEPYSVNEISLLGAGDVLLLYSDGFSEHAGGRFFPGEVERVLAESADRPVEAICEILRERLLAAGPPEDDVTAVVIRKTG